MAADGFVFRLASRCEAGLCESAIDKVTSGLAIGSLVYVKYFDDNGRPFDVWHERLVIGRIGGGSYVVATPTRDVFVEELHQGNADLADIRVAPENGLPRGISAADVFGFGEISRREFNQLVAEGERLARMEGALVQTIVEPAGVAAPPGFGSALVPSPAVAASAEAASSTEGVLVPDPVARSAYEWGLDEQVGVMRRGQVVALPPGCMGDCWRALGPPPSGALHSGLVRYVALDPAGAPCAAEQVAASSELDDLRTISVMPRAIAIAISGRP